MTRSGGGAVTFLICSLALFSAGCGSSSKPTSTSAAPAASATQTFNETGVPFTFSYPGDFAAVPPGQLPAGFVAILGIDRVNFIDVRTIAKKALSAVQLPKVVAAALAKQGSKVTSRERGQLGGRPLFTFVVASKAGNETTTSRLSFFAAKGKTYELGCQSDATGKARIDVACQQAFSSFALRF